MLGQHSFPNQEADQEGDPEEDLEADSLWDLQSGHGSHISGMIYA
jgi:hypothetical protein